MNNRDLVFRQNYGSRSAANRFLNQRRAAGLSGCGCDSKTLGTTPDPSVISSLFGKPGDPLAAFKFDVSIDAKSALLLAASAFGSAVLTAYVVKSLNLK
jgi:hypothetical protein